MSLYKFCSVLIESETSFVEISKIYVNTKCTVCAKTWMSWMEIASECLLMDDSPTETSFRLAGGVVGCSNLLHCYGRKIKMPHLSWKISSLGPNQSDPQTRLRRMGIDGLNLWGNSCFSNHGRRHRFESGVQNNAASEVSRIFGLYKPNLWHSGMWVQLLVAIKARSTKIRDINLLG